MVRALASTLLSHVWSENRCSIPLRHTVIGTPITSTVFTMRCLFHGRFVRVFSLFSLHYLILYMVGVSLYLTRLLY